MLLQWCQRHCCLCGRACGSNIEIAHINEKASANIDNAIPLCYDCHGQISHYNDLQPLGNKYRHDELKARRNQVYEQYTRHLVPPLEYEITQRGGSLQLPKVGFDITHAGDSLPIKLRVLVQLQTGSRRFGAPKSHRLYDGKTVWHLNPRLVVHGWFMLPPTARRTAGSLEAVVTITVIDEYKREHKLLPISWVLPHGAKDWFAHPAPGLL